MMTSFFIPGQPPRTTAQKKRVTYRRNGKPMFYNGPKLQAAEDQLMMKLRKHAPIEPYTEAVELSVQWCFRATQGKRQNGRLKTTRPDTDNLQKLLKDVMTKLGYWKDDALVAIEHVQKIWAIEPGIRIDIKPAQDKATRLQFGAIAGDRVRIISGKDSGQVKPYTGKHLGREGVVTSRATRFSHDTTAVYVLLDGDETAECWSQELLEVIS